MFYTQRQFEKAVEKEVQRRVDEFYHNQWVTDRLDKLQDRVTELEIKSYDVNKGCVPVEQTGVIYTDHT